MKDEYCPAYFETVFVGESEPTTLPSEFAIITAYAPTGQQWPAARNRVADERLKVRLGRWPIKRITGQSPDGSHAEPGWLVPCTKRTAVRIGREFGQDAIYWVSGGELFILDTAKARAPRHVSGFLVKYRVERHRALEGALIVGAAECTRYVKESGVAFSGRDYLFSGEARESLYHSWSLSVSLVSAPESGVWALEETELPCGNDGGPEDGSALASTIVALAVNSDLTPESASARLLLAWRENTSRWIDGLTDVSRLGKRLPASVFE